MYSISRYYSIYHTYINSCILCIAYLDTIPYTIHILIHVLKTHSLLLPVHITSLDIRELNMSIPYGLVTI
jgi:hypothetical protein